MTNQDQLIKYIETCWQDLTIHIPEDSDTHFGLPHPFIAPSVHKVDNFVFRDQFYWDTFFTILSLVGTEHHDIAVGMVHNLLFLLDKLGYIPNSNNFIHLGRSQPPLLSRMLKMIYEYDNDLNWLGEAYNHLLKEYENVWSNDKHPFHHNVFRGLSRYYHQDKTHRGAEDESGWDYTPRFEGRALEILPIDLNSFLFDCEKDLAEFAQLLNRQSDADEWSQKAEKRREVVNELMWDEEAGIYFDYDFVKQKRLSNHSLASFIPMFSGLASAEQAQRLLENLKEYETEHGLTSTPKNNPPIHGKQWASPNGWAPLHYMVVEGLKNYGYPEDAKRIALKWVELVKSKFEETGVVSEKFNVVDPHQPPTSAVYPDQYGFAWTNSVTLQFMKEFS